MKISIICAMDENRGIGKDNRIPWRIKEDLVRLKQKTKGHVVILGKKTYESMVWYYNRSGNPLPGKLYIVVTHDKEYKPARENAITAQSIEKAIEIGKTKEKDEVFIIGGQRIFEQTIDKASKLYLTIVEGDFEGDSFFPDYSEFKKIVFEQKGESNGYRYTFLELEK